MQRGCRLVRQELPFFSLKGTVPLWVQPRQKEDLRQVDLVGELNFDAHINGKRCTQFVLK